MIEYIINSGLLLTLFYAFFILFMKKTTFFRFNRVSLLLGTAVCMLLPLADIRLNVIAGAEAFPHLVIPEITVDGDMAGMAGFSFCWKRLLAYIYLTGALAVMAVTVGSVAKTIAVIRQNRVERTSEARISIIDGDFPSFSFLRNIVISHEDYADNPVILLHELAHVKCHHSVDLLFFSAVTVLHWFNPLVWIARTELKMLHEYEADETVINQGIDATQYQLLLVKKAVGAQRFQLANGFNHTRLKNRITMMQTEKTNKWARLRYLLCVPVLMSALCLCTSNNASDEQPVPFNLLDEQPMFAGQGVNEFSKWVNERLVYPESAKEAGIQGNVTVSFVVDTEGKVKDVKIVESASEELDAEALRVVSQSPGWTPGKKGGKAVPAAFNFPIIFVLR